MSSRRWPWLGLGGLLCACAGEAPPLPQITTFGSGGSDATATATPMAASDSSSETTGPIGECGNGEIEGNEQCEGSDLAGDSCANRGHVMGTLACNDDCTFDFSGCGPSDMIQIPGGPFERGSSEEEDELPAHFVHVDTFYIDEHEVTVDEYAGCIPCSVPNEDPGCNWNIFGRGAHPVNCVDWSQAAMYCNWVGDGRRLPTEAEWEKAARGEFARTYPWGNAPEPSCERVVMDQKDEGGDGCGLLSSWPVGSRPMGASEYGVRDLAGNVLEWTDDWYAPYEASDTDNPRGPEQGDVRALRGGSFYDELAESFRSSDRYALDPATRFARVGFRCVLNPSVP